MAEDKSQPNTLPGMATVDLSGEQFYTFHKTIISILKTSTGAYRCSLFVI